MYINPGEFRHNIELQRCTKYKNDDNIPAEKWDKLYSTKAKIVNVHGDEFLKAQAAGVKIDKTFYIRCNPNFRITEKDRILYDGYFYNIKYSNNIKELNQYYELKGEVIK